MDPGRLVTVKGTTGTAASALLVPGRGVEMADENVEMPAADEAPAWLAGVEAGLAKAAKYWTASEAQVEARDLILEEMDFDLDQVERKLYPSVWDVDRIQEPMTGPSNLDPQVRELVVRLTLDAGCKAHATAFLVGIPPRFVGGMLAAGKAARAKAAPVAAAEDLADAS